MAYLYKKTRGMELEEAMAHTLEVQNELETRAWEIALRAEAALVEHKQEGHAQILLISGDIDHYVVLDDERGMDAAMSIEFGRAGYIDPDTGEVYGVMEGLFILTDAAHIAKQLTLRLPKERKRRGKKLKKKRIRKGVTQVGGNPT